MQDLGMASDDDLVILTDCESTAEATLLMSVLDAEAIFARLSGAHTTDTEFHAVGRLPLWVKRVDAERAGRILADWKNAELEPDEALQETPADTIGNSKRRRRQGIALVILSFPIIYMLAIPLKSEASKRHWGWHPIHERQFSATFPHDPIKSVDVVTDEHGHADRLTTFQARGSQTGCEYYVIASDTPLEDGLSAHFFDRLRSDTLANYSADAFDFDRSLIVDGVSARDVHVFGYSAQYYLGNVRLEMRGRWIAAPAAPLVAKVVCRAGMLDETEANFFLDSVRLPGHVK